MECKYKLMAVYKTSAGIKLEYIGIFDTPESAKELSNAYQKKENFDRFIICAVHETLPIILA